MISNRPTSLARTGLVGLFSLLPIIGGGVVRLAAPANIDAVEGSGVIDLSFDAVVGATDYQYNISGTWTSTGGLTTVTGIPASGTGTVYVRAMNGAVPGYAGYAAYSFGSGGYIVLNDGTSRITLNAGGSLTLN